jgi:hypothetical protein
MFIQGFLSKKAFILYKCGSFTPYIFDYSIDVAVCYTFKG